MIGFGLRKPRLSQATLTFFSLAGLVTAATLFLAQAQWWKNLEEYVFHASWKVFATDAPDQRVVVVDIDERSLREIGAWPWSRESIAELIARTAKQGAAVVLVDIVMPEVRSGDKALALVLSHTPVVLGQIFSTGEEPLAFSNSGQLSHFGSTRYGASGCPQAMVKAGSFLANQSSVGVRYAGHISPAVDPDGVVRRLPALICYRNEAYPALPLSGVALVSGIAQGWQLESAAGAWAEGNGFGQASWFYRLMPPAYWITNPALPGIRIPMESDGLTRIPFSRARSSYAAISAADILRGKPVAFNNAIVVIGSSAFGVSDSVPLPLSGLATGMEVHLQMLSGLLDSKVVYRPAANFWWQALLWAAISTALYLAWRKKLASLGGARVILTSALVVPILLGVILGSKLLIFRESGVWLFSLWLLAYPLIVSAGLLFIRQWQLNQQRNRALAHLHAFGGGGALAEHLGKDLGEPDRAALSSESLSGYLKRLPEPRVTPADATMIFADLGGFTSLSSKLSQDSIARLIHRFYGASDLVVRGHGGAIDSYRGDAFMALFSDAGHAQRAVQAVIELQALLAQKNPYVDLPPLLLKAGIDSGAVLTGVFGAGERLAHTVFGDAVNRAARYEAMTRELGYSILIGEKTYEEIAHTALREQFVFVGRFKLDGIAGLVGMFGFGRLGVDASGPQASR